MQDKAVRNEGGGEGEEEREGMDGEELAGAVDDASLPDTLVRIVTLTNYCLVQNRRYLALTTPTRPQPQQITAGGTAGYVPREQPGRYV